MCGFKSRLAHVSETSAADAGDLVRGEDGLVRPAWASVDPLLREYYDTEWGMPVRDEQGLFERLSLEAFQSGLSWATILRKREAFRVAFRGFDPEVVATFDDRDRDRLLADAGIVRNRAKIDATIRNARATLSLREHPDEHSRLYPVQGVVEPWARSKPKNTFWGHPTLSSYVTGAVCRYRRAARSRPFAASTSRARGGAVVTRAWNSSWTACETWSTARSKAAWFVFDGRAKPESFRTN